MRAEWRTRRPGSQVSASNVMPSQAPNSSTRNDRPRCLRHNVLRVPRSYQRDDKHTREERRAACKLMFGVANSQLVEGRAREPALLLGAACRGKDGCTSGSVRQFPS